MIKRFMLFVAIAFGLATCLWEVKSNAEEIQYSQAYELGQKGEPMVFLVGADWCPACCALRNAMRAPGTRLFVHINIDHPFNLELYNRFRNQDSIPQIWVMQKRIGETWKRWRER